AVLVCGGTFALVQFGWSNYVGPELVDIAGGLASIAALTLFCRVWRPPDVWEFPGEKQEVRARAEILHVAALPTGTVVRAWMPWLFLSVAVTVWGLAPAKALLN